MAVPISQPTPIQAKPAQVIATKSPVLRAPNKAVRIIDPENDTYAPVVNIGLMGLPGTGKTTFLADLIKAGAKIFVINTDAGGSGEETIVAKAIKEGWRDLFKTNFRAVNISDHESLQEFLDNPTKFYPSFYDFAPNFIAWEGFSNWQQTQLSEYVTQMYAESVANSTSNKTESTQRAEGLKFETADWGLIRNGTVRRIEDFLQMKNEKTGASIHHIVTVQEAVETITIKGDGGINKSEEKASSRPLVQGAGKNFLGQGLSVVLRLTKDGNKYLFENSSKTLGFTKNRGIDLPEGKFPADAMGLVRMIEKAYDTVLFTR